MKIFFLLILIFYFVTTNSLSPQTPNFYHYTSSNGLASSTIFDMLQDDNGFIWFATANGVSKFDGHRFKNYGINEGLNSNLITSIIENKNKEIYFSNYEKGVNFFKNDSIYKYNIASDNSFNLNFIFWNRGKLTGAFSGNLSSLENNKFEDIVSFDIYNKTSGRSATFNSLTLLSDSTLLASTSNGFYKMENNVYKKVDVNGISDEEIYFTSESKDKVWYACSDNKIFQIKNYIVERIYNTDLFNGKVNRAYLDSKGNLWFSIINKGFYVIYSGTDEIVNVGKKFGVQKSIINKFLEDNEGNIWVVTQGKGAFCMNNLYIKNYNEEDGLSSNNVLKIAMDNNGSLLIGTLNGLNILDNNKFILFGSGEDVSFTSYIHDLKAINDKVYVGSAFRREIVVKKNYKNTEFIFLLGASFCLTRDSDYTVGFWGNQVYQSKKIESSITKTGTLFYAFPNGNIVNRINKLYEDSDGNLWMGTALGLCSRKNGLITYYKENEILNSSISSIIQDNKDNVWFAGEKGVVCYNLKNKEFKNFKNFSGYDLSSSTCLSIDGKDRIWIGNMKGLYILDNNTVKFLNSGQGLPSDEVLSLYYAKKNETMWIGTSNGLSLFDIFKYDNFKLPDLHVEIENIKAGENIHSKFDNLDFAPEDNNIFINFRTVNYSSPSILKYQYKIANEWVNTVNDFLDFRSMKEGKYTLSLRAKIPNGEWSEPSDISFRIKPKFSETIWFPVSLTFFFAVLVISGARYRININRKQNIERIEISKRIFELKHQALSAMMNPHFIFNSLNSVQYLVNKGEKLKANEYISIMAKLIRMNLDSASNSFILLKEEIDKLKLYLEIEQMRFQDKFSYEIIADENVNLDSVMIPNMIIQPFVENAVWHGIMNSNKKGFVKISFRFEDVKIETMIYRCLIIKITDNGIGIKKSGSNKKEGHISKGIKMIEERLQLLSQELELPQPVILEDLSLRNENSTGTEVILSLPITLYKSSADNLN